MQELEKILEEIERVGNIQFASYTKPLIAVEDVIKIIRKHINDGWIPAEEKPSEDGFYVATMSGALVDQEEPFVALAEFEDGEWVDGDDVVAWRPLPDPYRPERSEGE